MLEQICWSILSIYIISVVFLLSFPLWPYYTKCAIRVSTFDPNNVSSLARVMCALWWLACVHQLMRLPASTPTHLRSAASTFQFVVYCKESQSPRMYVCMYVSNGYIILNQDNFLLSRTLPLRLSLDNYAKGWALTRIDVCVHWHDPLAGDVVRDERDVTINVQVVVVAGWERIICAYLVVVWPLPYSVEWGSSASGVGT